MRAPDDYAAPIQPQATTKVTRSPSVLHLYKDPGNGIR